MGKFNRGQRVKISETNSEIHTDTNGAEAIVQYTYYEAFGGDKRQDSEYSLFVLVEPGTKLIDWDGEIHTDRKGYSVSWFDEDNLTLIEKDPTEGLKILKEDPDED